MSGNSVSLLRSWLPLFFPFSNKRSASITALLCCPCPYIKKSGVRPNLLDKIACYVCVISNWNQTYTGQVSYNIRE